MPNANGPTAPKPRETAQKFALRRLCEPGAFLVVSLGLKHCPIRAPRGAGYAEIGSLAPGAARQMRDAGLIAADPPTGFDFVTYRVTEAGRKRRCTIKRRQIPIRGRDL